MDKFCFNKIFTCDIVAGLRNRNLNPRPRSRVNEHEAIIFNQNDPNLAEQAQNDQKQFNSSLQNPSKRGDKGI